jgi:hypothetical protein
MTTLKEVFSKPRYCPLTFKSSPPSALTVAGAAPKASITASPCLLTECAWYLPNVDSAGTVLGGGCSAPALASGVAAITAVYLKGMEADADTDTEPTPKPTLIK